MPTPGQAFGPRRPRHRDHQDVTEDFGGLSGPAVCQDITVGHQIFLAFVEVSVSIAGLAGAYDLSQTYIGCECKPGRGRLDLHEVQQRVRRFFPEHAVDRHHVG